MMPDDNSEDDGVIRGGKRGPDAEDLTHDFLPEETVEKTILDLNDPARIAVLRQLDSMYPEVDDWLPETIEEVIEEWAAARISVGGLSREQAVKVLMAMHGSGISDSDKSNAILKAVAADLNEDD